MKKNLLILLVAALVFVACKKDKLEKSMTISNFEVKPESNIAPTKVLAIYDVQVKNYGEFALHCQGAYKSLLETDTMNTTGTVYAGNHSRKDTLELYYLHPGNYEIRIDIIDGASYSKSFTLQ